MGLAISSPPPAFFALGSHVFTAFPPASLSPALSLLVGPEGEERSCLLSHQRGLAGTHPSAPEPGSLGKPELRPLQQGFSEMLCLRGTPPGLHGDSGLWKEETWSRSLRPESLRTRALWSLRSLCSRGSSLGPPSRSPPSNGPPHRSPISLLFYLPLSKTIEIS